MNEKRAKEIVSSPRMVNVTYQGARIYMETVNGSSQTCTIHYMEEPAQKLEVPLSKLSEQ